MEEIDLWRAAHQMIKLYGPDAAIKAAVRADKMLDNGDVDGSHAWMRIVDIILDLEHKKPIPGDPVN